MRVRSCILSTVTTSRLGSVALRLGSLTGVATVAVPSPPKSVEAFEDATTLADLGADRLLLAAVELLVAAMFCVFA